MSVKLLSEHHLKLLSLKGGCTGSSESALVKIPHCWKSHVTAHFAAAEQFENDIIVDAPTCDFQQCGILTSVDSDMPVQPPFKLRNAKWCSVSSQTVIEYSSN